MATKRGRPLDCKGTGNRKCRAQSDEPVSEFRASTNRPPSRLRTGPTLQRTVHPLEEVYKACRSPNAGCNDGPTRGRGGEHRCPSLLTDDPVRSFPDEKIPFAWDRVQLHRRLQPHRFRNPSEIVRYLPGSDGRRHGGQAGRGLGLHGDGQDDEEGARTRSTAGPSSSWRSSASGSWLPLSPSACSPRHRRAPS